MVSSMGDNVFVNGLLLVNNIRSWLASLYFAEQPGDLDNRTAPAFRSVDFIGECMCRQLERLSGRFVM